MDRYLPFRLPMLAAITALNLHFCSCALHYLSDGFATPANDAPSLLAVNPKSHGSTSWWWTTGTSRVPRGLRATPHVILDDHTVAIAGMRDLGQHQIPRSSHSLWRPADVQASLRHAVQ